MADFVTGAVRQAESDGAAAVIIQLDTFGGSEDAMLRIDAALHSKIPTIVWVGPSGAKAASAGTFITLSANLAYMAPSTNIGAASPVAAGGADIAATYGQTEADKVMNDAIATIRSIAQERHPDAVAWAVSHGPERPVVHGAGGAVGQGDQRDRRQHRRRSGPGRRPDGHHHQRDGRPCTPRAQRRSRSTRTSIQSFLHTLDDPNIAFILLVIGVLCVAIELFHPTLLMGLAGALCLALSFYGSGSLPLNVLGVVLVVIGIGMLVLEPNVPSHGVLTIAGIAVFVVGAVAFYGSPGPYLPSVAVAWPIIGIMTAVAAAYGLLLVGTLMRMRRQPVPVGAGLVGIDKVDRARRRGAGGSGADRYRLRRPRIVVGRGPRTAARWRADTKVRVVGQEGLTLIVEKVD